MNTGRNSKQTTCLCRDTGGKGTLPVVKWCLMSSDVSWHIRDILWPMPKHGSINLYVHGNQKARQDGQPRTSTSTLTQLLNYEGTLPAQRTGFNTLDNWGHKTPTRPKRKIIVQELCESRGGRPGLSVLTSLGFRGRKELLNRASALVTACP